MSLSFLKEDFNKRWGLPFKKVGDKYKGSDYTAEFINHDQYKLYATNSMTFNGAGVLSVYGHNMSGQGTLTTTGLTQQFATIDAVTMHQVFTGVNLPHLNLFRMTKEEETKLVELERELEQHKKQQKIKAFKMLPPSIRQGVVDDIVLDTFTKSLSNSNEETFDQMVEIKRLRAMKPVQNHFSFSGLSSQIANIHIDYMHMRYSEILKYMTKEEIIAAHLEASLEEEISD